MAQRNWSDETEKYFIEAGWTPDRKEWRAVDGWRARLAESGFGMFDTAYAVLAEFGGIQVSRSGPGVECSRGGVDINPDLADGEEERFATLAHLVGGAVFPLGEAYGGHAFIGIDEKGMVYLVGDALKLLGRDMYEAADAVLEGRLPKDLAEKGAVR
jgi:hypothetical protein